MQRVEGDRTYRVRVSQLLQHIVTQLKDFLMWTIFKVFNEFVTILLLFVCLFVCFGPKTCGILALQPGIESTPPAPEGQVLSTELPGKSLTQVLMV